MTDFLWDPVERTMNGALLRIVDPGPLRAPIVSFVLRRTKNLDLVIETTTARDAASAAKVYPPGTLRRNEDTIRWENGFGFFATGRGVQPRRFRSSNDYRRGVHETVETSSLHSIEADVPDAGVAAYTIEWLDNVADWFHWPHMINRRRTVTETRALGFGTDGITITDEATEEGGDAACVRVQVGDMDVRLCARWIEPDERHRKPGCLIYLGSPDEDTLRRVRDVLSFSLGMYLVPLGRTVYSADWKMVSFKAVSPYSIDGRVFDLPVMPPVPLAVRSRNEIEPARLSRIASALYVAYDEVGFGDLGWGFWHARCATPHIAPVHFGAIIEALRKTCADRFSGRVSTKIVDTAQTWAKFFEAVKLLVDDLGIPDDRKRLLQEAVGRANNMPHKAVMESILALMGLEFGEAEGTAWRRRNDAAHGRAIPTGSELDAIRDTKFLRGLFDRMLLRLVDGSDSYIDYSSMHFPIRSLAEAPNA
jgi:hypothetical protein